MKLRVLLAKSLLLAAFFSVAGSLSAQDTNGPAPAQQSSDAAKMPTDKKKLEIPGVTIPRANGAFLGLEINSSSNFKLSFYDKDKNPVAPDLASATIRWVPSGKKGIWYTMLTPAGDGQSMASSKNIDKPWAFTLSLSLFAATTDSNPVESYTVSFTE